MIIYHIYDSEHFVLHSTLPHQSSLNPLDLV